MSLETTNQLRNSFFAKRVIVTINTDGSLDDSKRELFNRVLGFIDKAKAGKVQIDSGKLSTEPVESISAYKTALDTFFIMDIDEKKDNKCFNRILDKILKEVNDILDNNKIVSKETLSTTYDYFTNTRKLATKQASIQLVNQQEVVGWPTPMRF